MTNVPLCLSSSQKRKKQETKNEEVTVVEAQTCYSRVTGFFPFFPVSLSGRSVAGSADRSAEADVCIPTPPSATAQQPGRLRQGSSAFKAPTDAFVFSGSDSHSHSHCQRLLNQCWFIYFKKNKSLLCRTGSNSYSFKPLTLRERDGKTGGLLKD